MMLQFKSLIKSLTDFFSSEKIPYVILGGIAVSVYGEPRLTVDVDVNVILDKTETKDFLKKIKKFGFAPAFNHVQELARKTGVIPLTFGKGKVKGKVDVIIAENPLEFWAIRRGRMRRTGDLKINLISPEDLIIHKMASSRPKDYEDLKGVIQRQKGKLDVVYIQEWLKRLDEIGKGLWLLTRFNKLLKNS